MKFLNKYEIFYILHEHGVQPALKNNPKRQKTLSFISLLSLVCETQKIKMSKKSLEKYWQLFSNYLAWI